MKKILSFTSNRADYDLMSPLYRLLQKDPEIELKLIVSASHLSEAMGGTISLIKKDGFDILYTCETLLNSDSDVSRAKSSAILFISILEVVNNYNPDVILYCGDREDIIIYSILSTYCHIPSIHFYSGDHTTCGYVDNQIRHAASKLSSLMFVQLEEHKERLKKIGENEKRIFVVGNLSLDNFMQHQNLTKPDLSKKLELEMNKFCLLIFHPITSELDKNAEIFENILMALQEASIFTFVAYPNSDPGNFKLRQLIEKYKTNPSFYVYKNLPRDLFISIYKNSEFIIGNSSSGICESASIPIPCINVGDRQKDRFAPENVIHSMGDKDSIKAAIVKANSSDFKLKIENIENPYGDGDSAEKCYKLIKSLAFDQFLNKFEDPLEVENE